MEFVTAIIGPVIESLMVPIKKQLDYLVSSTNHVETMRTRMNLLDAIRVDTETHEKRNNRNNLQIPQHVSGWLEQVKNIKEEEENISTSVNGCFNVRLRYKVGRESSKILQEIDRLIEENSKIVWKDHQKPLGKVDSKKASTSASSHSSTQNDFKSRDLVFENALDSLRPDSKTQMIALCGMGGVGKTTMMEQLEETVKDRKMFDLVVKAVIGENTNSIAFQQAIADYMDQDLTEKTKVARADRLRNRFREMSQSGKKNILVILDDVWNQVDLKDIGLSPLPNQGVGFKFLLTSRDKDVCTRMGVESNSIFQVDVLKDLEAQNFFNQIAGLSKGSNPELNQTREDIVRRCGGLPIAIKIIASTLKGKGKHEWEDVRLRLQNHDHDIVREIFEISFNNLARDDDKAIFLLSGLFPEDFDIPIEDLMRYGWGMKLFSEVHTLAQARRRTYTCVDHLIRANLLIESDRVGSVKMHDLLRDFALSGFSKLKQASIVSCGNTLHWPTTDTSRSLERILLKCTGMSKFSHDFKYPNLALLKLMNGDKSLKFPEDFYEGMQKLEVVAYESMHNPLLLETSQYSTKLRTLCLRSCSLMGDLSLLGNLTNLEILSFDGCTIQKLPSTIGKLGKLKLLDLSGCVDLRIDDGVFQNLENLEELYMRVSYSNSIKFTDDNCKELEVLSKKLCALEVEFFENKAQPKNMSFENLERFMISMGCHLEAKKGNDIYSFENTLKLVTNHSELLESKINKLFEKTEKLYLQVNDMNDLEDVLVMSQDIPRPSFYNLKVLDVYKCPDLKYLFTVHVANGLTNLERLTISSCHVMEVLVDNENSKAESIKFQGLKYLTLEKLPKLRSLCKRVNVIELPQLVELRLKGLSNFTSIYPGNESTTSSMSSDTLAIQPFLNKEVVVPKLEKLWIQRMENLKEIWPCQIIRIKEVNVCILRKIEVRGCDSLVNLFPSNPMPLLHHLERLEVRDCGSIEVLFNIDLGCIGEIEEDSSSSLRRIRALNLGKLREIWRINGVNNSDLLIRDFQAVEYIWIDTCKSFRNVFTPTTTNFDMSALTQIHIRGCEDWGISASGQVQRRDGSEDWGITATSAIRSGQAESHVISKEEISEVGDDVPNVAFPFHFMHTFHHLQTLGMESCEGVKVAFDMESASSRESATTRNIKQALLLPDLKDLHLSNMERMSHVWRCKWNKLSVPEKQQPEHSFHNLTNITLWHCNSIKYLFSPLMVKFLSNLKKVEINYCNGIEEVVSNRDDEDEEMDTSTHIFPCLDTLQLRELGNLKRIGGGGGAKGGSNEITYSNVTSIDDQFKCSQVGVAPWSLCQYSKKIEIHECHALSSVIASHAVGQLQKLEELVISWCSSMIEVFEVEEVNYGGGHSTNDGDGAGDTSIAMTIPRSTNTTSLELPNLKILKIDCCDLLEHVFTSSTFESLKKLEVLAIKKSKAMQVIVKEDGEHATTSKVLVLPRLKSLTLGDLPNLKGFFLGTNEFRWPLLDEVKIYGCPEMMIFTCGHCVAPNLKYIHTSFGKHRLEIGLNFQASHETQFHNSNMCSTPDITKFLQFPCSFSNLIEVVVDNDYEEWLKSRVIFPFNELDSLQNLEKFHVTLSYSYTQVEELFEVIEGTNDDVNKTRSVVTFHKLKEVTLQQLESMTSIWKSNSLTTLNFPNLRKLSIKNCIKLGHVFTSCMVGSLLQLQELEISDCNDMEIIVKQVEDSETRAKEVVFPRLKSLTLELLPNLKGFCLGKEAFLWPSLDTLEIKDCPQITVFTHGQSTTPELKVIDTTFRLFYVKEDLTSFIKTKQQEGFKF